MIHINWLKIEIQSHDAKFLGFKSRRNF